MKHACKFLPGLLLACLSSCSSLMAGYGGETRQDVSSSLVDYLYPDGEEPPKPADTFPPLVVPMRVGLAIVPGNQGGDSAGLSEADKIALLDNV